MGRPYRGAAGPDKGHRPPSGHAVGRSTVSTGPAGPCSLWACRPPRPRARHRRRRPRSRRPRRAPLAGRLGPIRHRPRRRVEPPGDPGPGSPPPSSGSPMAPGSRCSCHGTSRSTTSCPASWPAAARVPTTSPSRCPTSRTPSTGPGRFGIEPIDVDRADPEWHGGFLHPKPASGVVVQLAEAPHAVAQPTARRLPGRSGGAAPTDRVRRRRPPSSRCATWWRTSRAVGLFGGLLGGAVTDEGTSRRPPVGGPALVRPARGAPGGRRPGRPGRAGGRLAGGLPGPGPPPRIETEEPDGRAGAVPADSGSPRSAAGLPPPACSRSPGPTTRARHRPASAPSPRGAADRPRRTGSLKPMARPDRRRRGDDRRGRRTPAPAGPDGAPRLRAPGPRAPGRPQRGEPDQVVGRPSRRAGAALLLPGVGTGGHVHRHHLRRRDHRQALPPAKGQLSPHDRAPARRGLGWPWPSPPGSADGHWSGSWRCSPSSASERSGAWSESRSWCSPCGCCTGPTRSRRRRPQKMRADRAAGGAAPAARAPGRDRPRPAADGPGCRQEGAERSRRPTSATRRRSRPRWYRRPQAVMARTSGGEGLRLIRH